METLCKSCMHVREVVSGTGSRFLLCQLSQADKRFAKYPPQPIVKCDGYRDKPVTTALACGTDFMPARVQAELDSPPGDASLLEDASAPNARGARAMFYFNGVIMLSSDYLLSAIRDCKQRAGIARGVEAAVRLAAARGLDLLRMTGDVIKQSPEVLYKFSPARRATARVMLTSATRTCGKTLGTCTGSRFLPHC